MGAISAERGQWAIACPAIRSQKRMLLPFGNRPGPQSRLQQSDPFGAGGLAQIKVAGGERQGAATGEFKVTRIVDVQIAISRKNERIAQRSPGGLLIDRNRQAGEKIDESVACGSLDPSSTLGHPQNVRDLEGP